MEEDKMNLIKRHKGLAIVGGLALILLIVIFAIFARMLFSSGKGEYGDRLNGLVNIDKSETNKLISEIKDMDEVRKVSVRTQGKIIYMTITFEDDVSKDKAKEIANKTYGYYNEKVVKYYDFEYFLRQQKEVAEGEEDTSFVIVGTKHPNNDYISWTKS